MKKDLIIIIYIYVQLPLQFLYKDRLAQETLLWSSSTILGIFILSMIYFFKKETKRKHEKILYLSLLLLILIDLV